MSENTKKSYYEALKATYAHDKEILKGKKEENLQRIAEIDQQKDNEIQKFMEEKSLINMTVNKRLMEKMDYVVNRVDKSLNAVPDYRELQDMFQERKRELDDSLEDYKAAHKRRMKTMDEQYEQAQEKYNQLEKKIDKITAEKLKTQFLAFAISLVKLAVVVGVNLAFAKLLNWLGWHIFIQGTLMVACVIFSILVLLFANA